MVRQEPPINNRRLNGQTVPADDVLSQQQAGNVAPMPVSGFDIQDALNQIEEAVLDSPRVPMMGRTMVNEDDLLDQLDAVRLNLPAAFQEAQQLLEQRNTILNEAEQYAQEIVMTAEKQAAAILNETVILRQAEQQAQQLRLQVEQECAALRSQTMMEVQQLQVQTKQECDELRQAAISECHAIQTDADTYADQVLQRMETQFSEMLGVISNGRQQLYERQQRARQANPVPLDTTSPSRRPGPPAPQRTAPPTQPPQQSYINPSPQQPPPPRRKF
ncbi:ATP synthase F0 subunit B [Leptothoe sp. PORK10 BA2]|uniref:ATP synthase F0 subunit B n=1 Tax=Leptothoe sp. PORK10 BA2 TaxID=3110254 RepID=UPI002B1FF5C8|nr:ATP synthase F0 subunit B [Leptothoe sp. PORK10 BA2]MEA5464286.1 ATP synthase F0 subunit B [Leptothoe sp. PORK10 BA2]